MDRDVHISISTGSVVKIIMVLVFAYLLYFFSDLVLVVLTAIVIASAVEPGIKWIESRSVPRIFGVLTVFTVIIGAFVLIGVALIPTIATEASQFMATFPQYLQNTNAALSDQASSSAFLSNILGNNVTINQLFAAVSETLGFAAGGVSNIASLFFGSILNFILIFVLAFYFASQEYGIDNFLKIVVPPKHSKYAINLWRRSQRKIGLWMQGQLVIMLMTGVFVYLFLALMGIPYAFVLALIAATAELVPVVGAFISAIPAIIVASIDGGATVGIVVAVFYLFYQQIQGNLISPMVVSKVVGVPPMLVLLGLIVGAQLFGILGAILSVPVAAALMEYIKDIEKEHSREIMRRKMEEDALASKIAEKVIEKTEEKEHEEGAKQA